MDSGLPGFPLPKLAHLPSIRSIKRKRGHFCYFTPRQIRVRVVVPGPIKAALNRRFLTTAHSCISSSKSLVLNRLAFYQIRAYRLICALSCKLNLCTFDLSRSSLNCLVVNEASITLPAESYPTT